MTNVFAQESSKTISSVIFDSLTQDVLPYAGVYNVRSAKGTASNDYGQFILPIARIGDSILISFIGYEDKYIVVGDTWPEKIHMSRSAELLEVVKIKADNAYLYDLIYDSKRSVSSAKRIAKTYLFSETRLANDRVELMEAYYNGVYEDAILKKLNIKDGRLGLKSKNNQYFITTSVSELYSLHNVFEKSEFFPDNPFCLSRKQLGKKYKLGLTSVYQKDGKIIMGIEFTPRKKFAKLFSGTIFIKQETRQIVKLELKLEGTHEHPFVSLRLNKIDSVDFYATRTFKEIDGDMFVDRIDIKYNVYQRHSFDKPYVAKTKTFVKAYDFENKFELPRFSFSENNRHGDYQELVLLSSLDACWQGYDEYRFYDKKDEIDMYMNENLFLGDIQTTNKIKQFSSYDYVQWSGKRLFMKTIDQDILDRKNSVDQFDKNKYNFNLQFFLDVRVCDGDTTYITKSILDPKNTYYYFVMTNVDRAFQNMLFDLLEIQRRELQWALEENKYHNYNDISALYEAHNLAFEHTKKKFISEVNRGRNKIRMKAWNETIRKALNIDNMKLFELEGGS